ncbi:MAG: hypothetical protein LBB23_01015 [Rickettsiales bacterium]|nr:hypothetical protein [Rickettsiales bacterium]
MSRTTPSAYASLRRDTPPPLAGNLFCRDCPVKPGNDLLQFEILAFAGMTIGVGGCDNNKG